MSGLMFVNEQAERLRLRAQLWRSGVDHHGKMVDQ